jgi:hypothetical protein
MVYGGFPCFGRRTIRSGLCEWISMPLLPLFVLYMITLLSIIGGWLPTYFVEKKRNELL